jgi:uncharacterized protein YgbK (DUF1537 family)
MKGSNTEIILDINSLNENHLNVETWALCNETRNIAPEDAGRIVFEATRVLKEKFGIEYFYKKIDSTLRGNISVEILAMLEATGYDAAIVAPAFVQEGRITIGGYQLLKGIPIERTDAARDPKAPIYESYIPDILKRGLSDNAKELVASIEMKTIAKGAGPIALKLNELISSGKKLIVMDSVSTVDFEQIVLAMQKSTYNILPAGSAGLAHALGAVWLTEIKPPVQKQVPFLPKLILSGSATSLTALQVKKLEMDTDIENTYFVSLRLDDVLKEPDSALVDRIVANLVKDNIVAVHVCDLTEELSNEEAQSKLIDEGITKEDLATRITDYLAKLASSIKQKSQFILITIGGETSYRCSKAINCEYLQVVDSILPSIPLCMDSNAQLIVTKSGNLGTSSTLIDIVKYFEHHE